MLYATVDETSRSELEQVMRSAEKKKWYRRLKIIDLSSRGYRVPLLADMFDLSAATVRNYLKRYILACFLIQTTVCFQCETNVPPSLEMGHAGSGDLL